MNNNHDYSIITEYMINQVINVGKKRNRDHELSGKISYRERRELRIAATLSPSALQH